jgi:hypothetical protein
MITVTINNDENSHVLNLFFKRKEENTLSFSVSASSELTEYLEKIRDGGEMEDQIEDTIIMAILNALNEKFLIVEAVLGKKE